MSSRWRTRSMLGAIALIASCVATGILFEGAAHAQPSSSPYAPGSLRLDDVIREARTRRREIVAATARASAAGAVPDRVSAPASTVVAPPPAPRHAAPPPVTEAQHTVRPGESLWVIASRQLGADASTAEIDRQWRAIYARNRSAIGADPNLIEPGQRLTLPPAPAAPAQEKP